jgi:hypothetical protein
MLGDQNLYEELEQGASCPSPLSRILRGTTPFTMAETAVRITLHFSHQCLPYYGSYYLA